MKIVYYFDRNGMHHVAQITKENENGTVDLKYVDKKGNTQLAHDVNPKENAEIKQKTNQAFHFYKIVTRPDSKEKSE